MTCGIPAPGPSEAFTTVSVKRSDVPVWFHVYSTKNHPTQADSFSEGWGDTRFAPIHAEDGTWALEPRRSEIIALIRRLKIQKI